MFVNKNYEQLHNKWRTYCCKTHLDWDEDVFSDTIVKVYDNILKKGLNDESDYRY